MPARVGWRRCRDRSSALWAPGWPAVRAAASLRDRGFDGGVLLIGAEEDLPYERPPLSKSYLTGELPRSKLFLSTSAAYAELGIEWRAQASAETIVLGQHELRLAGGERVRFDRLLLATGSRPRTLAIPGAQLPGVLTYRTLSDADWLRTRLEKLPRVVVVGGGFLGTELAVAARRPRLPGDAGGSRRRAGHATGRDRRRILRRSPSPGRRGADLQGGCRQIFRAVPGWSWSSYAGVGPCPVIWLWFASAPSPIPSWPPMPVWKSTLAWWSTAAAGPPTRPYSPPGTWPPGGALGGGGGCASSTTTTPTSRGCSQPAPCSTSPTRTTRSPYFWTEQYETMVQQVGVIQSG